jgi:hypothetical protein
LLSRAAPDEQNATRGKRRFVVQESGRILSREMAVTHRQKSLIRGPCASVSRINDAESLT